MGALPSAWEAQSSWDLLLSLRPDRRLSWSDSAEQLTHTSGGQQGTPLHLVIPPLKPHTLLWTPAVALDLSPTFEELGSQCPGSRGCRQPLPACFASRGLAQGPGQVPVSILGLLASCLLETPSAQQSRCAYSDLAQILPPCVRAHPPIRADQAPSLPWRLFLFPHLSWGGGCLFVLGW